MQQQDQAGRLAASGRPAEYWREQGISNIRDTINMQQGNQQRREASNSREASKLGTRTEAEVVSETQVTADTIQ
jgi:hypothetical protein